MFSYDICLVNTITSRHHHSDKQKNMNDCSSVVFSIVLFLLYRRLVYIYVIYLYKETVIHIYAHTVRRRVVSICSQQQIPNNVIFDVSLVFKIFEKSLFFSIGHTIINNSNQKMLLLRWITVYSGVSDQTLINNQY